MAMSMSASSIRLFEAFCRPPKVFASSTGHKMWSVSLRVRLGNCRTFHSGRALRTAAPRMTPLEVTKVLHQNEFASDQLVSADSTCPVKSYDVNSLKSNSPIEDTHAEAVIRVGCKSPNGMLFGIFDGHGGAACGQVVAKRILHYVAAGLLSLEDLKQHLAAIESGAPDEGNVFSNLVTTLNDPFELVSDLQDLYQQSYKRYVQMLKEQRLEEAEDDSGSSVGERMTAAFLALDGDMSNEALNPPVVNSAAAGGGSETDVHTKTLTVALSGAVGVVAHVDGNMLHVASTGDCTAVLGTLSENDTWIATKLTKEHNSDNRDEVKRILAEHPGENSNDIIKGDRLMGILAPLRALGDFKFKWSAGQIEEVLGGVLNRGTSTLVKHPPAVPPNYKSPPYLTAEPEVATRKLTARDRFLVIGSDGVWDMMTPMQVIRLVGEHMSGKLTLTPLDLQAYASSTQSAAFTLSEINSMLRRRQAAMKLKPIDSNAASHLIRSALGGTAYGVDHGRLSQMLSLPQDMVRMFRDDMTVTVIYFDAEYLRHC